jgi:hypothetical protein
MQTIPKNSRLILELERALRSEIELQRKYAEILRQEREHITQLQADQVEKLVAEREILADRMREANDRRLELMRMFPDHEGKRLTELVRLYCHPQDARRLLPLAEELRGVLLQTKSLGQEFRQVTSFSLNLINGALSILWSATQHVTRSYTPTGAIKESSHSAGTRLSGVLKQA